mmetsp:Transcript_954/g.2867  ORF Transcript_954/g.2867 Transcript_954/m.2867 type:complete len:231 (-) Transcript_954:22-714(-)
MGAVRDGTARLADGVTPARIFFVLDLRPVHCCEVSPHFRERPALVADVHTATFHHCGMTQKGNLGLDMRLEQMLEGQQCSLCGTAERRDHHEPDACQLPCKRLQGLSLPPPNSSQGRGHHFRPLVGPALRPACAVHLFAEVAVDLGEEIVEALAVPHQVHNFGSLSRLRACNARRGHDAHRPPDAQQALLLQLLQMLLALNPGALPGRLRMQLCHCGRPGKSPSLCQSSP